MNRPAVVGSQASEVALVSTLPDLSDKLSQELYDLIAQQPFFKGLNTDHGVGKNRCGLRQYFGPKRR
jgi:hypothetical protein